MNIAAPFIRRPIGTILLALGVFVGGLIAYFQLGVAALPNIEFPVIFVVANQPGADAENMASTVAAPLERHMGRVSGVDQMSSNSRQGTAVVILFFKLDKNIDAAARDVQAAINASMADLPAGLRTAPIYRKANPNNDPVLLLSLTSKTHTTADLYNMADSLLSQRVRQLPGVADVNITGGATPAVRVDVDLRKLSSMGLSADQVRNAISAANVTSPQGFLSNGTSMMTIAANDALRDGADFADIVIAVRDGVPIRLRDVAEVGDGQENKNQAAWFNGERAILMVISKQADANVIKTVDSIYEQLPLMRSWLPEGVELTPFNDRTATIRASVMEVQITLLISVALVIMTMLLFLRRVAPTVIAGLSVPLSLASAFIVMYAFGFTLDNLTLMALVISIGFVVDDAIVVIENIVRHMDMGKPRLQAALDGAKEIGFTIVSITASLIAVFVPLLFMGGFIGMFLHSFAVTISAAIAMSAIVSLTLTAALCGRYLQPHEERPPTWLGTRIDAMHAGMLAGYRSALDWSLRHPRFMSLQPLLLIIVTVWLTTFLRFGSVPQQDTGMMQGTTVASATVSYETMVALQRKVADVVMADPAVVSVGSSLGSGGGPNASANRGQLFINLKPLGDGREESTFAVMDRLTKKTSDIAGIQLRLRSVQDLGGGGGGPRGGDSQFSYSLKGSNYQELLEWGPRLADEMKKLPQLTSVGTSLDDGGIEQNLVIDRDTAARLGVSIGAISSVLYNAFGQRQISTIYSDLNQYRVVLNAITGETPGIDTLKRLYVRANSGAMVPLDALTRIEPSRAPLTIQHDFQFPVFDLTFNMAKDVSMDQVIPLIDQTMRNLRMPGSISGEFGGELRRFQQQQSSQGFLLLAAIIAVYLVLGILYESLIHPVTILSTLPSAGMGCLLAMIATDTELTLISIIAIVLLIGIVKKNAIMMVDFALNAERAGATPFEAIREACLVRFRPIIMTSMVAILAAVPLAIGFGVGSELRQPLGVAMIGGLLVSQTLTLLSTPALYLVFARIALRRREKRQARREARALARAAS